jgi:putative sterol carrier protein
LHFLQEDSEGFYIIYSCDGKINAKLNQEVQVSAKFPSSKWLQGLMEKLNSDEKYAKIARAWEGDLLFLIDPEGSLTQQLTFYLDLWHGTCRKVDFNPAQETYPEPVFELRASYSNITAILTGKLDPMTAMLTNKLKIKGNLGYMMRNVPTVLDFVRCAREVTSKIL